MKKAKKVLALFLTIAEFMGLISFNSFDSNAKVIAPLTLRDVILILDVSGSMYGEPLEQTKIASINFCKKLLNDKTCNSQIAIIAYDNNTYVENFTSDISVLESFINSLEDLYGTNLESALSKAGDLLLSGGRFNSIKSVVIMTDGQPNDGTYDSSQSRKYPYDGYASAVYNTAWSTLKDYDRYTLGFFHNLYDSDKDAAVQLLEDIQNQGYYEVIDAKDMDFQFGTIVDDIVDENKNCPIIILPGVMGSNLYSSNTDFDEDHIVWLPDYESWDSADDYLELFGLGKRLSVTNTLFVKPPEDQTKLAKSDREFGARDEYEKLVNKLCDQYKDKRSVYFFSYDWRNSNVKSAEKLNEFIESLNTQKVTLVCHSMGGIVASCYAGKYTTDKLYQVITCGTPYEGSPSMINIIQNWDLMDDDKSSVVKEDWYDLGLGLFCGLTKKTKKEFPSVAELLPSRDYVDIVPMWRDAWQLFGIGDYRLTTDQYVDIAKKIIGEENYNNGAKIQDAIGSKNGNYGVLADFEDAYFIIGTGKPTISSIKFQWSNVDIDEIFSEDDIEYTIKGDGTVPYASATMAEFLNPDVNDHVIALNNTNHGETAYGDKGVDTILKILKKEAVLSDSPSDKKYIVVRIACPVDATIQKGSESLSSSFDDFAKNASFGRLDMLGENNDIKILCLEDWDDYNIDLNATENGNMDYSIRWFDSDNNLVDERTFYDVYFNEDTIMKTNTNKNDDTILEIDYDGDGNTDKTYSAVENGYGNNKIAFKQNDNCFIVEDKIIFANEIKASDFLSIVTTPDVDIYNLEGDDLSDNSLIGTGAEIALVNESDMELIDNYTFVMLGDINGDGRIVANDARTVLRASALLEQLDEDQFLAADTNLDREITAVDAREILRVSALLDSSQSWLDRYKNSALIPMYEQIYI